MVSDYLSEIHSDRLDMYSHTLPDTYGGHNIFDIFLGRLLTHVLTCCLICYLIWYDMIWYINIFGQSSWHRLGHSMWHLSMQYLYHFYRTLRKPNICQKNINPLDILFVPTSNHIYKYFLFFFLQPPLVGCYPNVKQSCLVEIWSWFMLILLVQWLNISWGVIEITP